jgi:hypothetical protein
LPPTLLPEVREGLSDPPFQLISGAWFRLQEPQKGKLGLVEASSGHGREYISQIYVLASSSAAALN